MKAMLLIAFNYVREQRWPIFVLLLWILLLAFLGLIANIPRDRDELLYLFKQVAMYIVVFSIFFGDGDPQRTQKPSDSRGSIEGGKPRAVPFGSCSRRNSGLRYLLRVPWDYRKLDSRASWLSHFASLVPHAVRDRRLHVGRNRRIDVLDISKSIFWRQRNCRRAFRYTCCGEPFHESGMGIHSAGLLPD